MSKTEEVLKLMAQGENDTLKIKEQTGASESLITRCRKRYEAANPKQEEPKEEEATDDEIDGIITKIKVKPDQKYLTKQDAKKTENYHCTGCGHKWDAEEMPVSCQGCGCEF